MVSPGEYLGYVGSDEVAIGYMAARRAGAILAGAGNIAILGVSPTIETTTKRERGARTMPAGRARIASSSMRACPE